MSTHTEPIRTAGRTGDFVRGKVRELGALYTANTSRGVQAVATLAAAAGREPGSSLKIMAWTLDGLPAGYEPSEGASWSENAAHTAITLCALHQRSTRSAPAHKDGVGFGRAIGELHRTSANQEGVLRRFNAAGTSESWPELTTHVRGLVNLLKSSGLRLDYGLLARDLEQFQDPDRRDNVRLRWGRGFYRTRPSESATD